jgi:hypothetical protein
VAGRQCHDAGNAESDRWDADAQQYPPTPMPSQDTARISLANLTLGCNGRVALTESAGGRSCHFRDFDLAGITRAAVGCLRPGEVAVLGE